MELIFLKRKLIAIDLDGTTLNNQSEISSLTKRTIQELTELGHIVSIVTGRPYRNSYWYYDELSLSTPIGNLNGAFCHHPQKSNWQPAYVRRLPKEIALSLDHLKKYADVELIIAEALDTIYVDRKEFPNQRFFPHGMPKIDDLNEQSMNEDPISINIFTTYEDFQPFIKEYVIKTFGDQVEIRNWGGKTPCLEVVEAGVQKAMAVEVIARDYQIAREDILAFGDEDNDYEMLQYAGLGVRMQNSIDALKEVADDVTEYSNDEDGMAKYLRTYFDLD